MLLQQHVDQDMTGEFAGQMSNVERGENTTASDERRRSHMRATMDGNNQPISNEELNQKRQDVQSADF